MTDTSHIASETEARDVAESARETEWEHPSFARELYLGRFRLDLIHPHPTVDDPQEAARAKPFFDALRGFLDCGILAEGFRRVHSPTCNDHALVASPASAPGSALVRRASSGPCARGRAAWSCWSAIR